jgi:hypothetical protein
MGPKEGSLSKAGLILSIGVCLTAVFWCSCQPGPAQPSDVAEVRVVITRDMGNELVLDEAVAVRSGASALDALEEVAMVETKYGGGFVEAIDGVRSQYSTGTGRRDWLFYMNGMSAKVGARDYALCDGDVEHWDFRRWSFRSFVPAIVGDFPQPFLGGYEGRIRATVIAHAGGFGDGARELASRLKGLGVESVCVRPVSELASQEKQECNLILLGTTDLELISELGENARLGFFIECRDDGLVVFDSQGQETRYPLGCGFVQATQNPWNPKGIGVCENVVLVVSGMDDGQVHDALALVVSGAEEARYGCAAIVIDGEVIKVPRC